MRIGEVVILTAPGQRTHGMRHRIVSFWTDDFLGDMVECQCLEDPGIIALSWRPDQLVPADPTGDAADDGFRSYNFALAELRYLMQQDCRTAEPIGVHEALTWPLRFTSTERCEHEPAPAGTGAPHEPAGDSLVAP